MEVVNVWSPDWDPYSGYGRIAVELVYHLSQMGVYVNPMGDEVPKHTHKLTPVVRKLLEKPIQPTLGGIVLGYPTLMEKYGEMLFAGPVLIHTMFESTKFPKDWASWLRKADAISVPAKWLVNVVKNHSVYTPVHVHPLGVSENFKFVERKFYPDEFTFLTLGDRGMRKRVGDCVFCIRSSIW